MLCNLPQKFEKKGLKKDFAGSQGIRGSHWSIILKPCLCYFLHPSVVLNVVAASPHAGKRAGQVQSKTLVFLFPLLVSGTPTTVSHRQMELWLWFSAALTLDSTGALNLVWNTSLVWILTIPMNKNLAGLSLKAIGSHLLLNTFQRVLTNLL